MSHSAPSQADAVSPLRAAGVVASVGRSGGCVHAGATRNAVLATACTMSSRRFTPPPKRLASGPPLRSTRRMRGCTAATGSALASMAPRTVTASATMTRGCARLVVISSVGAASGARCLASVALSTSRMNCARQRKRLARNSSPYCAHARAMKSSWFFCTTSVPNAAATRLRGSRLICSSQRCSTCAGSSVAMLACQRPYDGGSTIGSLVPFGSAGAPSTTCDASTVQTSARLTNPASHCWNAARLSACHRLGFAPGTCKAPSRSSTGRGAADASRIGGTANPGSGRARFIGRRPTVGSGGTGCSRRASSSKSPASPVRNDHSKYTGSSASPAASQAIVRTGAAPGSNPARRPASKAGTSNARYERLDCSRRAATMRDRPSNGSRRSSSAVARASLGSAAAVLRCVCAQAQRSAVGGSTEASGTVIARGNSAPWSFHANSPSSSTSNASHGVRRA